MICCLQPLLPKVKNDYHGEYVMWAVQSAASALPIKWAQVAVTHSLTQPPFENAHAAANGWLLLPMPHILRALGCHCSCAAM